MRSGLQAQRLPADSAPQESRAAQRVGKTHDVQTDDSVMMVTGSSSAMRIAAVPMAVEADVWRTLRGRTGASGAGTPIDLLNALCTRTGSPRRLRPTRAKARGKAKENIAHEAVGAWAPQAGWASDRALPMTEWDAV